MEVANILEVSDKALEYIVSTKHIASRGDTLNSTLLTFNISSPVDDVIKVRLEHHRGPRELGPTFELFPDGQPSAPKTKIAHPDKEYVTFPSATLSVDLNTAPYSYGLTCRGDSTPKPEFLCATEPKGRAVIDVPYHLTLGQMSSTGCLFTLPDTLPRSGNTAAPYRTGGGDVRFMLNEFILGAGETIYVSASDSVHSRTGRTWGFGTRMEGDRAGIQEHTVIPLIEGVRGVCQPQRGGGL